MDINYKLRITEKNDYFALEYQEVVSGEWKEMIIRETKEEILVYLEPLKDEEGNIIIDDLSGKPKTPLSPYYYEET